MDLTLLKDGLIVMVIGMGTVYLFLTVMIWVMNLNNHVMKFINKFCPEKVPAEKKPVKKSLGNDEEIALAIACALKIAGKHAA